MTDLASTRIAPMSDDFLQADDLVAPAKPQQRFADLSSQRHRLKELAHLRGGEQLLHRGRLADIRCRVDVRA